MAEKLKRRVAFTVNMRNNLGFGSTNLYVFDESFIHVKSESGLPNLFEKTPGTVELKDPSLAACPVATIDSCRDLSSFACINSRIYLVGGSYFSDDERRMFRKHHLKIQEDYYRSRSQSLNKIERPEVDASVIERQFNSTKSVYCCDALHGGWDWKKCPDLNLPRQSAHLLVLGEKLYAAGGLNGKTYDFIFMEVLEESINAWIPLPNPPIARDSLRDFVSAAVNDMGFILIGAGGESPSFYTYDPEHGWQLFSDLKCSEDMIFCYNARPAVVSGPFLLWLDEDLGTSLLGIDLRFRRYFTFDLVGEGLLPNPNTPNLFDGYSQLVHLGQSKLCLIWRDRCVYKFQDDIDNNSMYKVTQYAGLHCTKFSITLGTASPDNVLNLKVISQHKCIVPSYPHKFEVVIAVDVAVPKHKGSSKSTRKRAKGFAVKIRSCFSQMMRK